MDLLKQHLGADPATTEGIAELLRCEISARGMTQRTAAIQSIRQSVAAVADLSVEKIASVYSRLVSAGDLLALPGGKVAPAPLRCVRLAGTRAYVFAGSGTKSLAVHLGVQPALDGLRRSLVWSDAIAERIERVGGLVLDADQWAQFDRTAVADADFLQSLDDRLGASDAAVVQPPNNSLDWRGWLAVDDQMRWRTDGLAAKLWRAMNRWGRPTYAWTAGGSPSGLPHLPIGRDDGLRAQFAEAIHQGAPAKAWAYRDAEMATLEIQWWLPTPEYRWLTLYAVHAQSGPGRWQWRASLDDIDLVLQQLHVRLGVQITKVEQ